MSRPGRYAMIRSSRSVRLARAGRVVLVLALASSGVMARSDTGADDESVVGRADEAARSSAGDFFATDGQLRELIATLLEANPQVDAAWSRTRSSRERVPQQRSLPDPQVTYRFFAQSPETRVGPQNHSLELSQGLPWRGKRGLQAERAESLASGSAWQARDTERELVADLKKAYFELAYLQEALVVNAEERDLLDRFEEIALRRYTTGQGIQQSVVKVQTDISRLEEQRIGLRERRDVVLRRIGRLIGRPGAALAVDPVELPLPAVRWDREALEQAAVSTHPRVRAIESRVRADRIWAERRKLESRPDFRVGVGYTTVGKRDDPAAIASPPEDNGKDIVALSAGFSIPIYRDRIRAGVSEAHESEAANRQLLRDARDGLRFGIQDAATRFDALDDRARLLHDVIIPQAEESIASAEAAYTTNRLGFLDLLDAERVLFQARLSYHRMISDLWIALADLERSLGRAFPEPRTQSMTADRPETGTTP